MTVQALIQTSLRKIGSLQAGESGESSELTDGLASLNSMIGSWNATISKALAGQFASYLYTFSAIGTYSAISDTVDTDSGLEEALIYNLAVALATEYGRDIPKDVAANAVISKNALMTVGGAQ